MTDLMRLVTGAQGTMGIVVWASVKLELIPAVHRSFFVPNKDIGPLVDFVYKLTKVRLGDEVMLMNRTKLAELLAGAPEARAGLRESLPEWVVLVNLGGAALLPEERVRVQEKELRALAQSCSLSLVSALPGAGNAEIVEILEGKAGKRPSACLDVFYLTTLDKAPQHVATMQAMAVAHGYSQPDIGIYIQPQHHGVAHHVEFNFPYDPASKTATAKVKAIYEESAAKLAEQGAYFSRPYGVWAETVYGRDPDAVEMLRAVKKILDPANIMNPGKLCF